MEIWLVRHAVAVEPEEFPGGDEGRPLTPRGRRRFRLFAQWLASATELPEVIVSSPLVRTVQTSGLLAKACGLRKRAVKIDPRVGPGCRGKSVLEIAWEQGVERVALVGHQPDMSICAGELQGGGRLVFAKGCVAAFEISHPALGAAQLKWFVGPKLTGDA
ncbi:MAG: SixA phosphatase family protein [Planctomycetaceae bacterium]